MRNMKRIGLFFLSIIIVTILLSTACLAEYSSISKTLGYRYYGSTAQIRAEAQVMNNAQGPTKARCKTYLLTDGAWASGALNTLYSWYTPIASYWIDKGSNRAMGIIYYSPDTYGSTSLYQ